MEKQQTPNEEKKLGFLSQLIQACISQEGTLSSLRCFSVWFSSDRSFETVRFIAPSMYSIRARESMKSTCRNGSSRLF